MRTAVATLAVLASALLGAAAALAPGAGAQAARPTARGSRTKLPVPLAFRLPATDGYTVGVLAEPPRDGTSGQLELVAQKRNEEAVYSVPATIEETSMHASLGALGEVSVDFQRSGRPTNVSCGKQTIRFDSGSWDGTIAFHGENGYTSVEADSAPGDGALAVAIPCGPLFTSSSFRPRKGAELYIRNPGLGPELTVYKHRPGAAAQFSAWLTEYDEGIAIERSTTAVVPGRDFTYDRDLGKATLTPPAPFSGSASFDEAKKAGMRWSGDLTVEMPGRPDVPLTGPLLRATLSPSE